MAWKPDLADCGAPEPNRSYARCPRAFRVVPDQPTTGKLGRDRIHRRSLVYRAENASRQVKGTLAGTLFCFPWSGGWSLWSQTAPMPDAHEVSTPFQINLQLENWVETTCNDDLWLAEEKMRPDKAVTFCRFRWSGRSPECLGPLKANRTHAWCSWWFCTVPEQSESKNEFLISNSCIDRLRKSQNEHFIEAVVTVRPNWYIWWHWSDGRFYHDGHPPPSGSLGVRLGRLSHINLKF